MLGRFDRVEDNAIMTREVVSNSLFKQKGPENKGQLMIEDLV
jgi:hypothetical protein